MGSKHCVNCMKQIDETDLYCTHCGYTQNQEELSPFGMKPNTILRGRYLVGRILGQGGFGITYVGYDLTLDVKVAIKEYFPMGLATRNYTMSNQIQWNTTQLNREQWQQGCENFLKEARQMAKIDTLPGIVRVRDTFPENQTSYIVMDYIEGETLKQKLLKAGKMNIQDCITMFTPLMQSLGKMHQRGLIHRDISPDNIMVSPDGSACLLDFGAAKDVSFHQNAASQQVAKKGFSPPEQYREKGNIGPWTDVYALSATIYYCVTGRMIPDAMERMYGDSLQFDPSAMQLIGAQAAPALADGLKLRIEERIQTVDELLRRLTPQNMSNTTSNISSQQQMPVSQKPVKQGKFSKKKIIGIAAAAVLGLAMISSFSKNKDDDKETSIDTEDAEMDTDEEISAEPDEITAEQIGTPNANLLNYGGYIEIPKQHIYYVAGDNAVYHCTYDEEDQTFYLGDAEKLCDFVSYLTLSDQYIYFITNDHKTEKITRIDYDGSHMSSLHEITDGRGMGYLQYVRLSDQREYLYYMLDNEKDADISFGSLYRYDLDSGKNELVVDGNLHWYNIYGDGIFYTDVDIEGDVSSSLIKTDLDGQNAQVLNDDKAFLYGFAEDEALYLYSYKEETLLVYNLDGTQNSDFGGFYDCDIDVDNCGFSYGDGWLFYTNAGDGSIHRIRSNGTGDAVFAEGHTAVYLCCSDSWVWYVENLSTEKKYQYQTQANYAFKTGETQYMLQEPDLDWLLPSMYIPDCQYTETDDGTGIIITGYSGSATRFKIPDKIDGKPVVSIGERAFEETGITEIGLPDSLLTIGEAAFYGCADLTFVGFPEGLVEIGDAAFGNCASLEEIELPQSLTTIGHLAFAETNLSEVFIPANVEEVGAGAFALPASSGLTEFTVSEENEHYMSEDGVLFLFYDDVRILMAFPAGGAGSYTIPDDTAAIFPYAFAHCRRLTELIIPKDVMVIGSDAFRDVGFSAVTISADCTLPDDLGSDITINYY